MASDTIRNKYIDFGFIHTYNQNRKPKAELISFSKFLALSLALFVYLRQSRKKGLGPLAIKWSGRQDLKLRSSAPRTHGKKLLLSLFLRSKS